jgi:hypothetical protein
MKKLLMFIVLVTFSVASLTAQETTFNKGDKVLNLDLGLGSAIYSGVGYSSVVPPLSASLEIGIVDNILEKGSVGVGGYLGFSSHKTSYWRSTSIIIGPRGAFHYALVDKLDTYAGLIIGYNVYSSKWIGSGFEINDASSGGIVSSEFIGARYYFSDSFAANAELGVGISYLSIGVSLKL